MQATTMYSQFAAAQAVGTVTSALTTANAAVNVKEMSKIMNEFNRINERMAVNEEVMDDALSAAFDNEGIEEEADNVTSQVLAELGIELDQKMVGLHVPSAAPVPAGKQVTEEEEEDVLLKTLPDLQARLNSL
jgi:division protein CdvB (Snf7/Vps24/ESCRT-III family)